MYVFSEWRSIRPVAINQYDITMATLYDITIGNVVRDTHCEIIMGNIVAMERYGDVTMSNYVATSHGITMHNDFAKNLFFMYSLPNCLILLCVVWNKNKSKIMFDQSELKNTFIVLGLGYFIRPSD